jgi:hypothetical protein
MNVIALLNREFGNVLLDVSGLRRPALIEPGTQIRAAGNHLRKNLRTARMATTINTTSSNNSLLFSCWSSFFNLATCVD